MPCGSDNCPQKELWVPKRHTQTGKYSEELEDYIAEAAQMDPPVLIDPSLAFEYKIPKAGLDYWLTKAAAGGVPSRTDINPREIAKYLPYIALVDATEEGGGKLSLFSRLAGEEFERVYGSIRQKDLSTHLEAGTFDRWCTFIRIMQAAGAPIRLKTKIAYERKMYLDGEFLLAPLRSGTPDTITIMVMAEFRTDS